MLRGVLRYFSEKFIGGFEWDLVVQLLGHISLFVIPWTAARQASLSSSLSQNLHKCMSMESVILFNHLISAVPFSFGDTFFFQFKTGEYVEIHMTWKYAIPCCFKRLNLDDEDAYIHFHRHLPFFLTRRWPPKPRTLVLFTYISPDISVISGTQ